MSFSAHLAQGAGSELGWPPDDALAANDTYARYADVYDALFDDLDTDASFYIAAADSHVSPPQRLLEIGVGTGRLTARLLDAGHHVVGLDSSSHMLARAIDRFGAAPQLELVLGDVRAIDLPGDAFLLAIAPYGMVAHLLTNADRFAAYRSIYDNLAPGGVFLFDDRPSWLAAVEDGTALHVARVRETSDGDRIRLMTNTIDAADAPVSVRYDFVDRIDAAGRLKKRTVVRIAFRNIALADELELLARAGFERVDVLGGFDGRPLDMTAPGADARLVLRCYRDR
jgi:SAM-dependent methyltransferase